RGKRSRKQALARRMERAAIAAAVQAAEAKVRRPPPTSPLGQAVLAGLTLLTIGVAVVGSYFVFEQWPKENQALNLAGDVQAQVAEFERLQLRIDLEHNVLQHTLQHGEPATDGDTDDETAEPAQEQEAADA